MYDYSDVGTNFQGIVAASLKDAKKYVTVAH